MSSSCIDLLAEIVTVPSVSGNEADVSVAISRWLCRRGISHSSPNGNIVALQPAFEPSKKNLVLLAHIDTVAPAEGWQRNPFDPGNDPGIIYGLGANDDGGSVVAMLETFCRFCGRKLPFNLMLWLVREEECSGPNGLRWLLDGKNGMPAPDLAIVGEPTGLKAATSERGLLVIDGEAVGESGHAARGDGRNALYTAIDDIAGLRKHRFGRISGEMGEVRLNVTQIASGTAHNVIPDRCRFTVDIRPNELYTPREILDELQGLCASRLSARNLRHRASATAADSPLRRAAAALRLETFSSPTSSDWMQLPCDALKIGPGDSARSHRPDEYILIDEVEKAVELYGCFIEKLEAVLK